MYSLSLSMVDYSLVSLLRKNTDIVERKRRSMAQFLHDKNCLKFKPFAREIINKTMDFELSNEDSRFSFEADDSLFRFTTVFESYESILQEFSDPSGTIDHEIILKKIKECSQKIENVWDMFIGSSHMETLSRLHAHLGQFFAKIQERKISEASGNTSTIARKKHNNNNFDLIEATITKPKINGFIDIAGLWEVKNTLKMLVMLPKQQPQLFENRRANNTLLLYGPPGTGKTLISHAIAAESGAVFHSISTSDILSSLVGESEKFIKYLFEHAKEKECSIIFIDEIDGLCRQRTKTEQDHTRRLKTEILCQMSNMENCKNVFVICATNCPWDLDTAFLRRFQKKILIPLPEPSERLEILKFHTQNLFENNINQPSSGEWGELVDLTEGLSSSDMSTMVQNAIDSNIMKLQETKVWKKTVDGMYQPAVLDDLSKEQILITDLYQLPQRSVRVRPLNIRDLIEEAGKFKPTVSLEEIVKFDSFQLS